MLKNHLKKYFSKNFLFESWQKPGKIGVKFDQFGPIFRKNLWSWSQPKIDAQWRQMMKEVILAIKDHSEIIKRHRNTSGKSYSCYRCKRRYIWEPALNLLHLNRIVISENFLKNGQIWPLFFRVFGNFQTKIFSQNIFLYDFSAKWHF